MNNIVKYFEGEKLQCIAGIVIAIACISASVYFFFLQKPVLRGVSYSFIPLSAILLVICTGVVIKTPKDIKRVTAFYNTEPQKIQADEIPRMERVMKSFALVKKIEVCFFLAGLLIVVLFRNNPVVKGIAIGLMIQGMALFTFDHIAEARGKIYLEFLRSL